MTPKDITMQNYELFMFALRQLVAEKKSQINPDTNRRWTQAEIAKQVNCSPGHFIGVLSEKDKRKAGPGLQQDLAEFFGTTVFDMYKLARQATGINHVEEVEVTQNAHPRVINLHRRWDAGSLEIMSAEKLSLEVSEWSQTVSENFAQYSAVFRNRVKVLSEERNRLYNELETIKTHDKQQERIVNQYRTLLTILTELGIGIIVGDKNREPILANDTVFSLIGLENKGKLPTRWEIQSKILSSINEKEKVKYLSVMESPEMVDRELRFEVKFKDGKTLSVIRIPILTENGDFQGAVATVRTLERGEVS